MQVMIDLPEVILQEVRRYGLYLCPRDKDLLGDAIKNAVPVVHGRWIAYPECLGYTGAYYEHHIVCSECHDVWNIMDNDADRFDFCPHCGAKMDGERKEE